MLFTLSVVLVTAAIAACSPVLKASSYDGLQALTKKDAASDDAMTLQDCLGAKNVPVFFATSSGFAALAKPYNLRLPYTPSVIVIPTTTDHIRDAVHCASDRNVKVQAKGGGHSYASYSIGGQNGSMIIDLQEFQEISVDAKGVARVGGGVRLGNMALGIYNHSRRALPHGTCPGVGIGGHASHGGYGYDSRLWGLTLDTIVGMDVILANGTSVFVSEAAYPDLWYSLRGAADSFGIITTFHLQTLPAPSSVINWAYTIPGMYTSATTTASVFQHIQSFSLNASVIDPGLGFGVHIDGSSFSISGTYIGDAAHFNNTIAPALLSSLPTPSSSSIQVVDWITSLTLLAAPNPLQEPTEGYNLHDDFFAKSLVVPSSAPLTIAALESYFAYIITHGVNAPSPWFSIINLYGGPGSKINEISASDSAYSDRDALWVLQHYGFSSNQASPYPPASVEFVNGLNKAITDAQPETRFKAYLNYVDPSLSPAEAHDLYYGEETYGRLVGLKGEIDPAGLFWNPQAVGN